MMFDAAIKKMRPLPSNGPDNGDEKSRSVA
jgi:hypothetical protein